MALETSKFASATLKSGDCIDFQGFSTEDIKTVNQAISKTWTTGIQKTCRPRTNVIRVKLRGYPWYSRSRADIETGRARTTVCAIFEALYNRGWIFQTTFNKGGVSTRNGLDCMFKKEPINGPRLWFAIHWLPDKSYCITDAPLNIKLAMMTYMEIVSKPGTKNHSPGAIRDAKDETTLMEIITANSCEVYACISVMSLLSRDTWICCTTDNGGSNSTYKKKEVLRGQPI